MVGGPDARRLHTPCGPRRRCTCRWARRPMRRPCTFGMRSRPTLTFRRRRRRPWSSMMCRSARARAPTASIRTRRVRCSSMCGASLAPWRASTSCTPRGTRRLSARRCLPRSASCQASGPTSAPQRSGGAGARATGRTMRPCSSTRARRWRWPRPRCMAARSSRRPMRTRRVRRRARLRTACTSRTPWRASSA